MQTLDLPAVPSVQSGQNVRKMELEFGMRLHVQTMRTVQKVIFVGCTFFGGFYTILKILKYMMRNKLLLLRSIGMYYLPQRFQM